MIYVPDFNISSFVINPPSKRPKGDYGSVLNYDNNDIIIQTPVCCVNNVDIKEDSMNIKFKLSDNFEYFQFFSILHELIIKHLIRYYGNDNYNILSESSGDPDDIRKRFIPYIRKMNDTEMLISLKLLKKTEYFDRNKREISGLEIKPGDYVVCIIKSNQLSIDSISATHTWNCLQCLVWKPKSA